jgi:hypothetical protein
MCIKGGVGKSTLAGVVSYILASEEKQRVLVVDDNYQQANVISMLTDGAKVQPITGQEILNPSEYLPQRIQKIEENLDVLGADYIGIKRADANLFWSVIVGLDYDYVVVDTTPNIVMPEDDDHWQGASLALALIAGDFPAVFVVPFTPVDWGIQGLDTTRDMLSAKLDRLIPVAVQVDSRMVPENIPEWMNKDPWKSRLGFVAYCNRFHHNPQAILHPAKRRLWEIGLQNPLVYYRPIASSIQAVARQGNRHADS